MITVTVFVNCKLLIITIIITDNKRVRSLALSQALTPHLREKWSPEAKGFEDRDGEIMLLLWNPLHAQSIRTPALQRIQLRPERRRSKSTGV